MAEFIQSLVTRMNGTIVDPLQLLDFAAATLAQQRALNGVLSELRSIGRRADGFVQFAPPVKGPVLWGMIRPEPWACDLLVPNDPRRFTCGLKASSNELDPQLLACGKGENTCNIEHANSFRTLYQIGSLPCCSTPPFCSAPRCAPLTLLDLEQASTCTKRAPEENVAYMQRQDAWPAYHGWGGSFEMDTAKYLDALRTPWFGALRVPPSTFDLALDLGANYGYYTEKFTLRNLARNYIMVDASPDNANTLRARWGNKTWRDAWFSRQVRQEDGAHTAGFEIIAQALSNRSGGTLDMCPTEGSFKELGLDCHVEIDTVDHLISDRLSPEFQAHVREAQSAFIKVDTEGMDELVLRGMQGLLQETRGTYGNGKPRYLVNFMQFEFSPALMGIAKRREGFLEYDIKTATEFLESIGFESFLIGPRFLPLSHGSWSDEYKTFTEDPSNNAGTRLNFPDFDDRVCPWCASMSEPSFTADVLVVRASHPRATELKLALGACKESSNFDIKSSMYQMKRAKKRSAQEV